MNDPLIDSMKFTEEVEGKPYTMWRRSSLVMVKARGMVAAFGQAAGAKDTAPVTDIDPEDQLVYQVAILSQAMITPAMVPMGEEGCPPESYAHEQIAPLVDVLFMLYMNSGVDATPFLKRSTAEKEPG